MSSVRTQSRPPVFYLESKLGAPLTLGQLRRYRKYGVDYLIAITKGPPEVGRKDMVDTGVFTFRWQDLHRRLASKRGPTRQIAPRNGFEIADACLGLLRDLRLRFVEEFHPELSAYHAWGPGYFNWTDDEQNEFHAFGWDLFKGKWSESKFGIRLWLPQRLALSCSVHFDGAKVSGKYEERSLKSVLSPGGIVSREVLLSWLDKCAKRWKLATKG